MGVLGVGWEVDCFDFGEVVVYCGYWGFEFEVGVVV